MKKGFALLETIIVITFVTVSLLLLYGTFTSMVDKSKKNILYDDATNIYKMYYLKEYLLINDMEKYMNNYDIIELSCSNFSFDSCNTLWNNLKLNHLYLVHAQINETLNEDISNELYNYLHYLSFDEKYEYLLVGEFFNENEYSYASVGVNKI